MTDITYNIIFTSDVHGNDEQYKRVVSYALQNKPCIVLFGGDISPKAQDFKSQHYLQNMEKVQREWLETKWISLLTPLKENNIKCYVILGNGDVSANYDVHLKNEENQFYCLVNNKRIILENGYELVGYPYCPFSFSSMKDFEKFDITPSQCPSHWKNHIRSGNYNKAYHSVSPQRRTFTIDEPINQKSWKISNYTPTLAESDNIELDLKNPVFTQGHHNKTIAMFHSPPINTIADIIPNGTHVGSIAIRMYLERVQPYVALFGHVHETVVTSGTFFEKLGMTTVFASGNDPLYKGVEPYGKSVWVLHFDVRDLDSVKRICIE